MAGAQRSLLATLGRISAFGWQATTVLPAEGLVADAYRREGLEVQVLPAPEPLMRFDKRLLALGWRDQASVFCRDVLPYSWKLAALARSARADLIHFNNPRGILMAGWAGLLARLPVVLHVRGATQVLGPVKWAVSQSLATRIVLVAEALSPCVAPQHRGRARVVHNGVDVPESLPDKAAARARLVPRFLEKPLAPDEVLVLSLSSRTPFKGLHHLLEAASLTRDSVTNLRFLSVGVAADPDYERYVRRRRDELHLSEAFSIADVTDDPYALLAAADLLVLPSVDSEVLDWKGGSPQRVTGGEGLPRVILEAMAHGLPVVASGIQGVAEQVLDGVCGRLVRPGDPAHLAAALLEVSRDRELLVRTGAAGRARVVEGFSTAKAAAGLSRVFEDSLREGRGRCWRSARSKSAMSWC